MDLNNRIDPKPLIVSDDQVKPKKSFKKNNASEDSIDLQKININSSLDNSKNDSLEFLSNKVELFENNYIETFDFVSKKPTNIEFSMLEKACKNNSFNITVYDNFIEVGKNKINDGMGILTPEGLVFDESYSEKDLKDLPVFYADNMSSQDKELAKSYLKDNPKIYFVTSDQMSKLKIICNNRLEKEARKEVKESDQNKHLENVNENLNITNEDSTKESKFQKIVKKITLATHFFKNDILKEHRAREKRHKNEAIEKRKEIEFQAYKENQDRIDEKLDDSKKKLARKNLG